MSEININFKEIFKDSSITDFLAQMSKEKFIGPIIISKDITDWLNEESLELEVFLNESALILGEGLWHLPTCDDLVSPKVMQLEDDFYLKKLKLKNEYFDYIDRLSIGSVNDKRLSCQYFKSLWKVIDDSLQFGFKLLSDTVFKSTHC